jgi:hypothetical protein
MNIVDLMYRIIVKQHVDDEEEEDEEAVPEVIASQSSETTTTAASFPAATMISPICTDFIFISRRKGAAVTPDGLMPRKSMAELREELNLPFMHTAIVARPSSSFDRLGSPTMTRNNAPSNQREMRFQQETYSKTSSLSSPESALVVLAPIREEQHDHHYQQLGIPNQPTRSWTPSTHDGTIQLSQCYSPSPSEAYNNSMWTAESPNLVPGLTKTAVGNLFALQTSGIATTEPQMQQLADPPGTTPLKSTTSNHSQQWDYTPQDDRVEDMFSPVKSVRSVANNREQQQQETKSSMKNYPKQDQAFLRQQQKQNPTTVSSTDVPLFSPCVLSNPRPTRKPNQHRTTEVIIEKWKNVDMQLIKARNQKHQKEDLLVQVFERLQDNVELVQDIESLYFNHDFKTANHPLLVGLAENDRHEVLDKIDMILLELNQDVPTTEFFFSPGKADHDDFRQDHSELKNALTLTKSFVELAIPNDEKETASLQGAPNSGYWKFLHHERIGVSVPDTPTAADSSFFSLPEAATTPMTSNVSLGNSTLTTRPQTVAGNGNLNSPQNNGLELRQALHILSNGLERIGTAIVRGMLENQDLITATEEIKAAVAVIWALSTSDLTTMVDAFEFILEEDEHHEHDDPHYHPSMNGTVLHAHFLGSGSIVSRNQSESYDIDDNSSSMAEDDLRRSVGSIDEGDYHNDDDEQEENNNIAVASSSPQPWQVYL